MARKKNVPAPYVGRMSAEQVRQMVEHRRSGAAGVHADQNARRVGATSANRQRTRSQRRRAAIADYA